MEDQLPQYKHLIWTDDKGLMAALFVTGLSCVKSYQSPPDYKLNGLFADDRDTRRLIKEYAANKLTVPAFDYFRELSEIELYEDDAKQYIHHTAKTIFKK